MKTIAAAVSLGLMVIAWAGCANHHIGPVYHAGDERPPQFLTGAAVGVLTNMPGFSAHVEGTVTTEGSPRVLNGQLLVREGRLIFQPTLAIKGKRARAEGGLYFIWDETRHSGFVMSEALQGYAPVAVSVYSVSPVSAASDGIKADINGHPCHRTEAIVDMSNGEKARVIVWRADDNRHFPVRIETVQTGEHMIVNFSDIRWEYPSQELFHPPDGFTLYASSVAMMNELIVRDASLARKYDTGDFEAPVYNNNNDWRPLQPVP